jgi:hypothetical protein
MPTCQKHEVENLILVKSVNMKNRKTYCLKECPERYCGTMVLHSFKVNRSQILPHGVTKMELKSIVK